MVPSNVPFSNWRSSTSNFCVSMPPEDTVIWSGKRRNRSFSVVHLYILVIFLCGCNSTHHSRVFDLLQCRYQCSGEDVCTWKTKLRTKEFLFIANISLSHTFFCYKFAEMTLNNNIICQIRPKPVIITITSPKFKYKMLILMLIFYILPILEVFLRPS